MITEAELQKKIIVSLERQGWFVIVLVNTNKNGCPRILALSSSMRNVTGKIRFIEVQAPGYKRGVLSAHRRQELRDHGFSVIEARSVEDVDNLSARTGLKK